MYAFLVHLGALGSPQLRKVSKSIFEMNGDSDCKQVSHKKLPSEVVVYDVSPSLYCFCPKTGHRHNNKKH